MATNYIDCLFHSVRITGKTLSSLDSAQQYLFKLLLDSPEILIPENNLIYGLTDLNLDYPAEFDLKDQTLKFYQVKSPITVFQINETQLCTEISKFFEEEYKLFDFQLNHLQAFMRESGIIGYLDRNKLMLTCPRDYIK